MDRSYEAFNRVLNSHTYKQDCTTSSKHTFGAILKEAQETLSRAKSIQPHGEQVEDLHVPDSVLALRAKSYSKSSHGCGHHSAASIVTAQRSSLTSFTVNLARPAPSSTVNLDDDFLDGNGNRAMHHFMSYGWHAADAHHSHSSMVKPPSSNEVDVADISEAEDDDWSIPVAHQDLSGALDAATASSSADAKQLEHANPNSKPYTLNPKPTNVHATGACSDGNDVNGATNGSARSGSMGLWPVVNHGQVNVAASGDEAGRAPTDSNQLASTRMSHFKRPLLLVPPLDLSHFEAGQQPLTAGSFGAAAPKSARHKAAVKSSISSSSLDFPRGGCLKGSHAAITSSVSSPGTSPSSSVPQLPKLGAAAGPSGSSSSSSWDKPGHSYHSENGLHPTLRSVRWREVFTEEPQCLALPAMPGLRTSNNGLSHLSSTLPSTNITSITFAKESYGSISSSVTDMTLSNSTSFADTSPPIYGSSPPASASATLHSWPHDGHKGSLSMMPEGLVQPSLRSFTSGRPPSSRLAELLSEKELASLEAAYAEEPAAKDRRAAGSKNQQALALAPDLAIKDRTPNWGATQKQRKQAKDAAELEHELEYDAMALKGSNKSDMTKRIVEGKLRRITIGIGS